MHGVYLSLNESINLSIIVRSLDHFYISSEKN